MINGPLFSIGKFSVWPYGLCMGLGIICCFAFLYFTMIKKNFNDEAIDKILLIGICATAFGVFMAAVFQGVYNAIAGKGFSLTAMTFYGGLIGGIASFVAVWNLYIYVIAPRTKVKVLKNNMNAGLSDALTFIPIGITIAHAFGRLGCTMYGCCHGGETEAWYGIYMYMGSSTATKVVPTQLFECIFLIILTGVMALLFFKFRFKYNMPLYCIAYGVWRFCIEYIRTDERGELIPGLTPSQFWAIIFVIGGIGLVFVDKYVLNRLMKHPELQPPVREKKEKKVAVAAAVGAESAESAEGVESVESASAAPVATSEEEVEEVEEVEEATPEQTPLSPEAAESKSEQKEE